MKKGSEYEVVIGNTEFPGIGVGYFDGTKVLIKNTVPGQKVKIRVNKIRKDYVEGKLISVMEHAEGEVEPMCPHFNLCGGCTHQFISYIRQLELKKEQVLHLFNKAEIAGYEFQGIEKSPLELEYRNKMEFTFGDFEKGGELSLGMHMPGRSFGVLTVDNCILVDKDIRKVLKITVDYFNDKNLNFYKVLSHEGYLRNLVVRKTKSTEQILVNIVTTSQLNFDLTEYKDMLVNSDFQGVLMGVLHTTNDSLADMVTADKMDILYGQDIIIEEILNLKFRISPFSFFQTNSLGAERLYDIVRGYMGDASDKIVYDLYCGTGTIGQIAAEKARGVIGIEIIDEAVNSAKENAKLNGINNCTFIAGDVAKVIQAIQEKPDIIILDPPRSGVHPVALNYIVTLNAAEIIYVSCNPKTLVEDLKVLVNSGYKVEKMILMDMFPHTPHVETICRLIQAT